MQQLFITRGFVLHHNVAKGPRAKCQPVRGQPVCSATISLHNRHIPVITHLAILVGSVFMTWWPSLGPVSQQCGPHENCPNTWIQGVHPNHGSFPVQESLPYQGEPPWALGWSRLFRVSEEAGVQQACVVQAGRAMTRLRILLFFAASQCKERDERRAGSVVEKYHVQYIKIYVQCVKMDNVKQIVKSMNFIRAQAWIMPAITNPSKVLILAMRHHLSKMAKLRPNAEKIFWFVT